MKNNKFIKFVLKHIVAITACALVIAFSVGFWVLSAVPAATSVGNNIIVAGNVGIGTDSPGAQLDIYNTSGGTAQLSSNTVSNRGVVGVLNFYNTYASSVNIQAQIKGLRGIDEFKAGELGFFTSNGTGTLTEWMTITKSGNVGIGTTAPAYQLQLSLNSAAKPTSSSWTIASDERLKKNISTLEGALDKMLDLHGVTYEWIEPEKQGNMTGEYMGLIAQEVEKVFPEWITTDSEGYKNLTVTGFEALTAESFRELKAENDALKARIEALEARLNIEQ